MGREVHKTVLAFISDHQTLRSSVLTVEELAAPLLVSAWQVNLLEANKIPIFKNSSLKIICSSLFHSLLLRENFSTAFLLRKYVLAKSANPMEINHYHFKLRFSALFQNKQTKTNPKNHNPDEIPATCGMQHSRSRQHSYITSFAFDNTTT